MKSLVLAGGSGTRLRPITHTSAKQMVPVANMPVIFYGLRALAEAGIRDCGVVVGDSAGEIMSAIGDGSKFGLTVTYLHQEAPLGLAHALLISRDYLGDDDFVMYLGDNFIVGGITDQVTRFRNAEPRPAAQIMLTRVRDPRQFGVAELDADDRVVGLAEKPAHPRSDLALVGVYLFTSHVLAAAAKIKPSWRGELEITDAIQQLIDEGLRVDSCLISGYWKDTGNVDDMLEVNRLVLDTLPGSADSLGAEDSEIIGRVTVEEGARIRRSRIVGPAIIGPGAVIEDSYVGPYTAVGGGCQIIGSEIEYSILLPRAGVRGVRRIEASLIGHDVEVTPAPAVPRAHRLVLGDHSKVQISS